MSAFHSLLFSSLVCVSLLLTGCHHGASPRQSASAVSFKAFDRDLNGYDYPYPVSYFSLHTQGQKLRMAYMDVQPKEDNANGQTVLLLHGKNFTSAYWEATIAALTESGYRVIAPDQIGFGKSTKPEHLQYTFQALATWTHQLMTHLGIEHYSVAGHSMGGMLATRYALMYPQQVRCLVLINPIGLEDWRAIVPYRSVDEWYQQELQLTPDKIRAYQRVAYFDGNWEAQYDKAIIPQAGWTLHRDYPIIARNSALHYDMIFTQPVLYEFSQLQMPVLLLIGTRDRTALGRDRVSDPKLLEELGRYDRLGRKTAAIIPNATLAEFHQAGHIPQVEIFDAYIHTLKTFLASPQMD